MTTRPAGRINKLFGTAGSVMLSLYDTFPDEFDSATTPLMVSIDGLDVPLWCERFERRGQTGAVAAFADLDTERRAEELLGLEFRIDRREESDDEEFYLEDLVGFEAVVEEAGAEAQHTGIITDFYDNEMNPLFEVEIGGGQMLIPAVEEFIAHIDFEERRIHFILPEGLLNLE